MTDWNIHHCDREYARSIGDPILGVVSAETKQDAERIASKQFNLPTGAWADEQHEERSIVPTGPERIQQIREEWDRLESRGHSIEMDL